MVEDQEADVYRESNALAAVTMMIVMTSAVACGGNEAASVTTTADATTPSTIVELPPTPATTGAFVPIEVTVTGVVISVDGSLGATNFFTIRLGDGSDLHLVPSDGLLFDGAAPLSHVRDHLVSGSPVRVTYQTSVEGPLLVMQIGDAGAGEHSHDD
jgi:hypothetical protein